MIESLSNLFFIEFYAIFQKYIYFPFLSFSLIKTGEEVLHRIPIRSWQKPIQKIFINIVQSIDGHQESNQNKFRYFFKTLECLCR